MKVSNFIIFFNPRGFAIVCTIFVASFASVQSALAEGCAFSDGGYCISQIMDDTYNVAYEHIKKIIHTRYKQTQFNDEDVLSGRIAMAAKPKEPVRSSILIGGSEYLDLYEDLWNWLLNNGVLTDVDKRDVVDLAKKSGGTKIGGLNLVVLAAATLQKLVDAKVVTEVQAQEILDRARN